MAHAMGAGSENDFRLDFDARVRLEFHGSKISSVYRQRLWDRFDVLVTEDFWFIVAFMERR